MVILDSTGVPAHLIVALQAALDAMSCALEAR